MLSTGHGQGENKLMPVGDSATLRKFAELITAEVRGERDLALKTVDRFAETITSQKQRLVEVEREVKRMEPVIGAVIRFTSIHYDGKDSELYKTINEYLMPKAQP